MPDTVIVRSQAGRVQIILEWVSINRTTCEVTHVRCESTADAATVYTVSYRGAVVASHTVPGHSSARTALPPGTTLPLVGGLPDTSDIGISGTSG